MDWSKVCITTPFGPYGEPVALLSQDTVEYPTLDKQGNLKTQGSQPDLENNGVVRRRSHLDSYFLRSVKSESLPNGVQLIGEFTCGLSDRPVLSPRSTCYLSLSSRPIPEGKIGDATWSMLQRLLERSIPLLEEKTIVGWRAFQEAVLPEFLFHEALSSQAEGIRPPTLLANLNQTVSLWAETLRLKWYLGKGQWIELLDPTNCSYPQNHPFTLEQVFEAVDLAGPRAVARSVVFRKMPPHLEASMLRKRVENRMALYVSDFGPGDVIDELGISYEPMLPTDIGDAVGESGGFGWDLDHFQQTLTDELMIPEAKEWIDQYAEEVVGIDKETIRKKFEENFPPLESITSMNELLDRPYIAYVRRSDFPSENDWASFLLNELFEHNYGYIALMKDLERFLTLHSGKIRAAFVGQSKTDLEEFTGMGGCLRLIQRIEYALQDLTLGVLKKHFGCDDQPEQWLFQGVPQATRLKTGKRRLENSEPRPHEESFDILDYMEIMTKHWKIFSEYFTSKGKKAGSAKQSLGWIKEFNQIRNRLMHASRHPPSLRRKEEKEVNEDNLPLDQLKIWLRLAQNANECFTKQGDSPD